MSECPPAGIAENVAVNRAEALTPEVIEAILADFRSWLHQAAEQAGSLQPPSADGATEPIDVHTVLGQFTALRHEVNLQTRATRVQQEQNTETLRQFGQAVEALKQAQAAARQADQQSQDVLLRPLLKVLIDVYDALTLAEREVTPRPGKHFVVS